MKTVAPRKFDRISRVLSLSMAVRLIIVTAIATTVGYFHIRSIVSDLIAEDLGSYTRMWGDRENQVFLSAEKSQTALAKRLQQINDDQNFHTQSFDSNFETSADGTVHENHGIDNWNHPSFFLPKTLTLDVNVKRRATLLYDFLDRECFLTLASFSDCWVGTSDGMLGVFYPNDEGYSDAAAAEFQKLAIVRNASSSDRDSSLDNNASRWTDIYFDTYLKKWMISLTTPIEFSKTTSGAIGKDIFLIDLLKSTVDFGKPGATNFIFTANGLLVAHPDFESSIVTDGKGVNAEALAFQSPVRRAFEITKRDPELRHGSVYSNEGPFVLALSRLPSVNWYLATVYPNSLVQKAAFSASRAIVFLGLAILMIELFLFLILLRKRLEKPIADLIQTIEKVKGGNLDAKTDIHTNDEFEILGNSFNDMTYDIQLSRFELEAALKKANEASEAKSQFVANMSHEIRTPLAGILGVAQLLKDTTLNEEQQKYANIIDNSGSTLLSIINQVLDVAKVEANKFELRNEVFSLAKMFEDVRSTVYFGALKKGLALDFEKQPALGLDLWGDVTRLKEVFINLVGNAIKYSDAGTITVTSTVIDQSATVTNLKFEVMDQGPGIPTEVKEQIYQAFIQGDSSNTRTHGGTGLGLFLCHAIVTMMGGQIQLEERAGFGAFFSFVLSFENRARTIPAVIVPSEVSADLSHVKPVLVVEDTSFNQIVAQSLIKKIGLKSALAENGKQAVDLFTTERYSLILMDCQMPVMDGYEATQAIRAAELVGKNRIPIIALTAKTSTREREKCLQVGMDDLITKPVRLNLLTEKIMFWLQQSGQV